MATPVLIVAGLVLASIGVIEGVLPSKIGWVSEQPVRTQSVALESVGENSTVADNVIADSMSAVHPELPLFDDPYFDRQWALEQIQITRQFQLTVGGREVLVAVLDTGVALNHEDLEGRVVAVANFTNSPVADDVYGHGTHVAGVIAANGNNGRGIVGVAPVSRIISVKVADDRGITEAKVVADGIVWAVDNGASVVNVSAEFFGPSEALREAVDYAWAHGALVIAAAGNQGSQLPIYPACYENCIAVAASTYDDTLAPLSNYGDWVDVIAPGFNIWSTLPGDNYGYKSGTSFAAAHVSGLAALLFAVATDTNGNGRVNDEVRAAIEGGCQEFNKVAAGRIDVVNSIGSLTAN